jgi:outer membrane protein
MRRSTTMPRLVAAGLLALARAHGQTPTAPETLPEALAATYRDNATIAAQRYALRVTDEQVPQALSGWRPSVALTGQDTRGRQFFNFAPPKVQDLTNRLYALQITQPIYHAGTEAEIDRAEASVAGGRQQLSSVEQQQLLAAAIAYLDVFRDQGTVALNRNLVEVLTLNQRNVDSTFRAGAATETDTSQAAARRSGAIAGELGAESQLATSRAKFRDVVGSDAGRLAPPAILGQVPPTEDEAVVRALARNPALLAARQALEAARHQVEAVHGKLLPKLDGIAQIEHEDELFAKGVRLNSATIGVQATVPLYEAGNVYSQVRAAKEAVAQAEAQTVQAERDTRQQIGTAWNALEAARAQQRNFRDQIRANEVASRDTEREVEAGARTRLDVLNAQQELFASRINLVIAEHDIIVASFQLEAAVGDFTPEALGLDVPRYDPQKHLDAVRDKWIGTEPPPD